MVQEAADPAGATIVVRKEVPYEYQVQRLPARHPHRAAARHPDGDGAASPARCPTRRLPHGARAGLPERLPDRRLRRPAPFTGPVVPQALNVGSGLPPISLDSPDAFDGYGRPRPPTTTYGDPTGEFGGDPTTAAYGTFGGSVPTYGSSYYGGTRGCTDLRGVETRTTGEILRRLRPAAATWSRTTLTLDPVADAPDLNRVVANEPRPSRWTPSGSSDSDRFALNQR